MSKKTLLYARVSTDQQSTGLEAQVRALKDYCHLNKIEDFDLFADEGISGTKSSRPALDRMMAVVRSGEASCVVVYSFSRFARSTTNMLNGLETMKANNCNFVSLTDKDRHEFADRKSRLRHNICNRDPGAGPYQ